MRKIYLFIFLVTNFCLFGQEIESDLYQTPYVNSLLVFKKSDKNKMTITTYRTSQKLGQVEETETTYRKGKINPQRINYSIKYTEFYIVEDRKRSVGSYEFDTLDHLYRYERSDYNNRNVRTQTHYSFFTYDSELVQREFMRVREYVGEGVEQDSVIYLDSVIYSVSGQLYKFRQENLSYKGVYSMYEVRDNKLIQQTNYLDGFYETIDYTYDSKGQLIRIDNTLVGADDKSIHTYTILRYSIEGLITEAIFYDQNDQALEKKVFTYK